MNHHIRKVVRVIVYLVYYNICLLLVASGIYYDMITMIVVALDQFTAAADVLLRPRTPREGLDTTTKLIALLFLLHPFLLGLLYYENLILTPFFPTMFNSTIISYAGISIYVIGSIIALSSRRQLGRYGDGTTHLKENHELITHGIYNHIRHPLYSGSLLGRIGFGLAFRAYLLGFVYTIFTFLIVRKRMEIEEESLILEFGEEYEKYMRQTRRLFPYIY